MKPRIVKKPPGPRAKEVLARDSYVISNLTRICPLVIEKASGVNLKDIDGNTYLDFSSCVSVANIGHQNPEIAKAILSQLKKASHAAFSDFYSELPVRFAERLHTFLPKNLNTVFFSNSGAEAVEAALKLSRYYTKRKYFLSFYNSFHGRTYGALSLTCSKTVHRNRFGPFLPVIHSPYAYCYRCAFGKNYPDCDLECVKYIENTIFRKEVPPEEIAAICVEPILGEGGYVVPPKKFHSELRKICNENGILYVADEIQTGNFRTGRFLASEHFKVKPDILCLAKASGGGLPLGITVSSKRIMNWPSGAHANTMGANLLACAAGLAVLDFFENKKIGEKVEKLGKHVLSFLKDLKKECSLIGDVRGKGLMVGIELVKDQETKQPAVKERDEIIYKCFEKGLILLPGGESTIRIAPPLIIEEKDIDVGLEILRNTMMYKKL